jgi:hypothetical protein
VAAGETVLELRGSWSSRPLYMQAKQVCGRCDHARSRSTPTPPRPPPIAAPLEALPASNPHPEQQDSVTDIHKRLIHPRCGPARAGVATERAPRCPSSPAPPRAPCRLLAPLARCAAQRIHLALARRRQSWRPRPQGRWECCPSPRVIALLRGARGARTVARAAPLRLQTFSGFHSTHTSSGVRPGGLDQREPCHEFPPSPAPAA